LSNGCSGQQLGTQFNGGQATVRGVETTVGQGVALSRGFSLDLGASYGWTDARFDTGFLSEFPQFGQVQPGDGLPYVPQHQGAGSASLNHTAGQLSVTATGRSGMRDAAGSGEEMDIPSSLTVDVAGELRFGEHWALYTSATNIADQRSVQSWRPFGARPNPPRQVMVGLKAAL
jgi:Fe(3+) dicitrate transport protein